MPDSETRSTNCNTHRQVVSAADSNNRRSTINVAATNIHRGWFSQLFSASDSHDADKSGE